MLIPDRPTATKFLVHVSSLNLRVIVSNSSNAVQISEYLDERALNLTTLARRLSSLWIVYDAQVLLLIGLWPLIGMCLSHFLPLVRPCTPLLPNSDPLLSCFRTYR